MGGGSSLRRSERVLSIPPSLAHRGCIVKTTGEGMLAQHSNQCTSYFCGFASRRKCYIPERLHKRPFQLAVHTTQELVGVFAGHYRSIRPRLNKSSEDIGDCQ